LNTSDLRVKHNLTKKKEKKVEKGVDFLGVCAILFSVMRDQIELEEVFTENDAAHQEELDRKEREAKRQAAVEMFWFMHKRDQQKDWG
jgi:hypothetical protein